MVDPDTILAELGLAAEPNRPELVPLGAVAERHRVAMIARLEAVQASISILVSFAKHHPHAEAAIIAQADHVRLTMNAAGEALVGLQSTLECVGEA